MIKLDIFFDFVSLKSAMNMDDEVYRKVGLNTQRILIEDAFNNARDEIIDGKNITVINRIDLSNTNMMGMPYELLERCYNKPVVINELVLNNNYLTEYGLECLYMIKCKRVIIRNNYGLRDLPASIQKMDEVEMMDFENCGFSIVPELLYKM